MVGLVGLTEGESTRRIMTDVVSSNYFATLGVPLRLGRTFTAEEERPGSAIPVAILSHLFWEKRGADPAEIASRREKVGGAAAPAQKSFGTIVR